MTERDIAVQIATKICRRLFQRTWMPWNATVERAVERMIDAIIAAAVEQLRAGDLEQELEEITNETDAHSAENGMRRFREWQRRTGRVA